jgi:uncharacterized protein YecE (DUF72 family)
MHVGTSGWRYDHWDGVLYPPGTPRRDRLAHYVRRFVTVELNASFYRWPRAATFTPWRRRLPPGFQLSVKAPRGSPTPSGCTRPRPGSAGSPSAGTNSATGAPCCSWADRIGEWSRDGRDVYAYVNNDGHGHAVRNAETLRTLVAS